MALSDIDKKVLNGLIDHTIMDIKPVVECARIPEFRGMLKDKDASDFSLGMALAEINGSFLIGFFKRNNRLITKDDRDEMFRILGRRVGEISEAISKCG